MIEGRQIDRGGRQWRRLLAGPAFGWLLALAGCGFFVNPNGTSTGSSSNVVYVANATASTVSGYVVGTGTLTAVAGLPGPLGYVPQAAVVSIPNTYLWIAGPQGIYAYTIGNSGILSSVGAVAASTVLAMDVSPDGQWLAALEVATQTLDIFQINTSSGALTPASTLPYNVASGLFSPRSVRFSPNGAYLFAALGAAGDVGFSFDTGTGVATATTPLSTGATTVSDNAVLVNAASTVLYIARSGTVNGVMAFTIGSGGALTPVAGSPFLAGMTPYALQLDATGSYLYVANRGSGTISGFSGAGTGVLTALAGSPFTSGSLVQSLALDSTGKYLLAAANAGAPDLTMYSFSTTTAGALDMVTTETAAAGDGSIAVAATH